MATTKIWNVRGDISKVINYASNKAKTEYTKEDLQGLRDVMDYAVDSDKTERRYYVSGINCNPDKAREQMTETKKRFNKTGGNIAYHAYQSFAPNEVTPAMAHRIGKEFAQRMWGDRFEIVVATHINKNHIHNHFVLNSVSFVDGKKYNDCKESYAKMRSLSDELCRENSLSVIRNPQKHTTKNYALYKAEERGEWTKDAIIRRDMDECILLSTTLEDFYKAMRKRGYSFNFGKKYPTVSHPDFERPRRMKTLGNGYSPEDITDRLLNTFQTFRNDIPEQDNVVEKYFVSLKEPSYKEIYVAFITVVSAVKKRPNCNRQWDKSLLEEMRKLDKLIEQQNLLCENDIETKEQLSEFMQKNESELSEITEARRVVRNKLKIAERKGDEAEVARLKDTVSMFSERAKLLRNNLKICERIMETEPQIESKIEELVSKEKERKEVLNNGSRRRSSRTNGENEFARR